jgi:hypothetical protein
VRHRPGGICDDRRAAGLRAATTQRRRSLEPGQVLPGTFLDAADVETLPSTPVAGLYRITYLPSIQEVGSLARSRTKTDAGELGTFTSATRPTSAGVRDLVRQAGNDIASVVGWAVPVKVSEIARSAVVLGTAMLIELSYFPEQVTTNRSPYQQYKDLYDQRLARVTEVVRETEDDGDPVAGDEGMPYFGGFEGQGTSMTEEW